jgi:hypothetical protein
MSPSVMTSSSARTTANQRPPSQADALLGRFVCMEQDGSLARRVRTIIATNRREGTKNSKAAA